ncbi:CaiB/BaiF CoA transferase family protein [Alicyclobacillus dauci]|uniref:CoA transferase n=1 Tax=Alicyclobacillus dauci TaxID=1475485 RepID=A0ABY6Z3P0_9BACL|nr:CoA transferase [Alicyclobacillus dauci]WAH37143.1 CoA transferase [Alicyclobacillus dauci]
MWPLEGVKVLDLTQNVAGPYAAMILAEFGADVTKVEPNSGDATRSWGPPFWNGYSPTYLALNRNKTLVSLDLKTPDGKQALLRLLDEADVLIVSNRPAALKRLELDYDTVSKRYPQLIYAEITAFGHYGPRQMDPGYDPLMQAMGGIMSVTGHPGDEPVRVGTSVIDMGTGMWMAMGVLSALRLRDKTGQGHRITGALFETAVGWMAYHLPAYWASGDTPHGWGSGTAMIAPYEAFPTTSGWIVIAAGNDKLFRDLSCVLGHPEWSSEENYKSNAMRVVNRVHLHEEISAVTSTQTSDFWIQLLVDAGIPVAPVADVAQLMENPQLQASDLIQEAFHADIPNFKSVGLPLCIDGMRPPLRTVPARKV